MSKKKIYIIEASMDDLNWQEQARFEKGQKSRFYDAPFDEEMALKEAISFKSRRYRDYPFVRVIIEV